MPDLKHSGLILVLCAVLLVDTAPAAPALSLAPASRTLRFSRFNWQVIHSEGLRGPGPNVFDARNVYLDELGRLVLETAFRDGRWTSAHVFLTRSLGYGS